jgi:hypothetical protein
MNKIATFFLASRAVAGAPTGDPHPGQNLTSPSGAWQVAHVMGARPNDPPSKPPKA